ncbi:TetR/AcrR family transcriptional regulator [Nonomuraea thailandensis]
MSGVKRPGKRAQKAHETRRRILSAALELFVRDGYGATNLQDVAGKAGVAVQTIYFVFGSKRALLKELLDVTIAGDDEPVATMDRPWYVDALAACTAQDMLRAYVAGATSVLERVAPIGRVLEGVRERSRGRGAVAPRRRSAVRRPGEGRQGAGRQARRAGGGFRAGGRRPALRPAQPRAVPAVRACAPLAARALGAMGPSDPASTALFR